MPDGRGFRPGVGEQPLPIANVAVTFLAAVVARTSPKIRNAETLAPLFGGLTFLLGHGLKRAALGGLGILIAWRVFPIRTPSPPPESAWKR